MSTLDNEAREAGFESIEEWHKLVSSIDISTPDKVIAFTKWKIEDGSKQGLLKLKKGPETEPLSSV